MTVSGAAKALEVLHRRGLVLPTEMRAGGKDGRTVTTDGVVHCSDVLCCNK
jgi:hypothetical protein